MANTLTIKTGIKGMDNTFTSLVNGTDLKPNQKGLLNKFLKDIGHISQEQIILQELENTETKETQEQLKQESQEQLEELDLSLGNWKGLTEEQQTELKGSLLNTLYGKGGEHLSTFPTLLDNKINTWVEETYSISKLPTAKKLGDTTFSKWTKENGEIKILPITKGDINSKTKAKTHYLIILLPNKEMDLDIWKLGKDGDNTLKYTEYNLLGKVTLTNKHFHILNYYTNSNKAYNQARKLTTLLQVGNTHGELERQKNLFYGEYTLDINGDGEYILKKAGQSFKDIGHILGREQHKDIPINYMETLQII
jgi:hypothetical protein